MHGPNCEEVQNVGVFLEVESGRRLVVTDAFRPGWVPSRRAFMVAEILFVATRDGRTRCTARASHWAEAARNEHEAMGSCEGLGEGRRPARGTCQADLAHEPGRRTKVKAPRVGACGWSGDQALLAPELYCTILPGSRIERVGRNSEVAGASRAREGRDGRIHACWNAVPDAERRAAFRIRRGGLGLRLDGGSDGGGLALGGAHRGRQRGWLKDRFGLSWQLGGLLGRLGIWPAMMKTKKIETAAVKSAAE